jgi:endonuclease III related protein
MTGRTSKCKHARKQNRHPPLREVYRALHAAFGSQHWWPARSRFEMMTGAILTQNTAWTNVEKAIANLRRARMFAPRAMAEAEERALAEKIRPAGYFNVKAKRLQHFARWLMSEHGGNIDRMFDGDIAVVRHRLLAVHGIGKETADSMLLYAGRKPVFVVDAYTRRFMVRHGWLDERASYDEVAAVFTERLADEPEADRAALYNEYHALIVELAKRHCRTKPDCEACPLKRWLPA